MAQGWRERLRYPSLKVTIIAIVFVVLLPTLGVLMATLYNTSRSFHEATTQQLLETARTVARSTDNELELTANVLLNFAEVHDRTGNTNDIGAASFANGIYTIYDAVEGDGRWQIANSRPPEAIEALVLAAAKSRTIQASNILPDSISNGAIRIAIAAPGKMQNGSIRVATLVASPQDMIHAVQRHKDSAQSVILAITDGTGRIIGRSVDGNRLIGKPVPDWQRLVKLKQESGSFEAQTLEGHQIVFAFQAIDGTPGWMAVVGEAASSFNKRWQKPIQVMLTASAVTVLAALILAIAFTQRALRPISYLAKRAQLIASGQTSGEGIQAETPPSFVAEFEALRTSLDKADKALQQTLQESRRAEQLAQDNNKTLREAETLAKLGHWSIDLVTGRLTASDMLAVLYGVEPDGKDMHVDVLRSRLAPESLHRVNEARRNCVATGEPYKLEVEHLRADGSTFAAYVQGKAVRDASGNIVKISGTVQDISERKEYSERLAALADNLPSGVIFRLERDANLQLSLAYVSAGLEQITGLSIVDLMSKPRKLLAAIPAKDIRALRHAFKTARHAGDVLDQEFPLKTISGDTIWIHCRAALRLPAHGLGVWDGIARDVTAEREAAIALNAAKEAAEAAEHAKSDFLATMSHEIRTPMNSVIGMSRLAMRTQLDPKQRHYLEKINESANVLLGIINDILDFSKIEAGGLVIEGVPFKLESVLETVSSVTSLRAEEKGLEITYAVAPNTPPMLCGDPLRLGQVITNLVGNAVKFTESGDVVVSISPIYTEQDRGNKLLISVRDTGVGLSAAQIAELFRPFSQAQSDTSRHYGGTGLGLVISKRLIEMMGGEVWVESEPGKGSTFFFTIELQESVGGEAERLSRRLVANSLRGKRILIVDDNLSARTALSDMVEGFGMDTHSVDSGAAALNALRQETQRNTPYDIVLLDWRMPGMDGVETARQIKADVQLGHMPAVLMVTAYGQDALGNASNQIGLKGVLLKPVTQSIMFNTLLGILSLPGPETIFGAPPAQPLTNIAPYAALKGKRILVTDDNALNREVATDFLELVGAHVVTAINGVDAIRQLESQDFDAVLMDMHMPVMNGLEAVREIRKQARWAQLPIIALTAQAQEEDLRRSLEAGMNGHLTKPIDEAALYSSLMEHCVTVQHGGATQSAAASPGFGFNRQRRENLLRGFLRDFEQLPDALDRHVALTQWPEVAELVHQLRGAAGYLDAAALCAVAETLERAARQSDATTIYNHVVSFRQHAVECLNQVKRELAEQYAPATSTPPLADFSVTETLALIERTLPLTATGDFDAKPLWEQLSQNLRHTPWSDLVRQGMDAFDDLEIEQALTALTQLQATLQANSANGT